MRVYSAALFHSTPFHHEFLEVIMFKWINCEVLPGMFPSERFVLVKDADGNDFGYMFANDRLVRVHKPLQDKTPVPGQLRVHAFNQENGMVSVMLPETTFEHGRYMRMPVNQLSN